MSPSSEGFLNFSPWQNVGQPATSSIGLGFNAGFHLNDAAELYGFGTFTHRVAFAAENFRMPDAIYNSDASALSVFPNGFTPYENINEKDFQTNVGVRRALIDWKYDLSSGFGKDDQSVYTRHTVNYSLTYPDSQTDFYDGGQFYNDWISRAPSILAYWPIRCSSPGVWKTGASRTSSHRVNPTPTVLQGLPDISTLSASARYTLLYEAPPDKEILNLNYTLGKWSFNARENRYGRVTRLNTVAGGNYYEAAVFTTDVGVSYALTRHLSLTLAGSNVFDKYPSTIPCAAQSASQKAQYTNVWDNSGPVGLLGGQYYARIEFRH